MGRLNSREITKKDGVKATIFEVICSGIGNWIKLEQRTGANQPQAQPEAQAQVQPQAQAQPQPEAQAQAQAQAQPEAQAQQAQQEPVDVSQFKEEAPF